MGANSALAQALASPLPAALPQVKPPEVPAKRNVFFSFHFDEDINRATIVRKAWAVRGDDEMPGFFDRSLWEQRKRTDREALKRMIREGLSGTTVTCVLSGRLTYTRPWVRFEIAASLKRGNGFLTAHIWPLYCIAQRMTGTAGPDPLSYMGVFRAPDDKTYVAEWWDGAWRTFPGMTDPIPWPKQLKWTGRYDKVYQLSEAGASMTYYPKGVGRELLPKWINHVAYTAK
jgi:hypothetical protein